VNVEGLRLVYYSPTGTSRRIAEAVAEGTGVKPVTHVNLTPPGSDSTKHIFHADELVVIAAPVYSGRVPMTAAERLGSLSAEGSPAVLVVVYGNRAYEDALLELKDMAMEQGFTAVAGAAFIGEHSYDAPETPIATGRPDAADIEKAVRFGEEVKARLEKLTEAPELEVPGNRPYRQRRRWRQASPVTDADRCTLCGRCAAVCPTGAVTVGKTVETVAERCTRCCACVKECPADARHWDNPEMKRVALWLAADYSERKEPEFFL
jgi:ferredoxin/flavodoxin